MFCLLILKKNQLYVNEMADVKLFFNHQDFFLGSLLMVKYDFTVTNQRSYALRFEGLKFGMGYPGFQELDDSAHSRSDTMSHVPCTMCLQQKLQRSIHLETEYSIKINQNNSAYSIKIRMDIKSHSIVQERHRRLMTQRRKRKTYVKSRCLRRGLSSFPLSEPSK